MTTAVDIHCINILLNSPNGNVQLVFNDFIKANAVYERLTAVGDQRHFINISDDYGQKAVIRLTSINSVILNDTAASLRGGAEIGLLNDVAKIQYQNRAQNHPAFKAAFKAASMMRNLANGLGPANG